VPFQIQLRSADYSASADKRIKISHPVAPSYAFFSFQATTNPISSSQLARTYRIDPATGYMYDSDGYVVMAYVPTSSTAPPLVQVIAIQDGTNKPITLHPMVCSIDPITSIIGCSATINGGTCSHVGYNTAGNIGYAWLSNDPTFSGLSMGGMKPAYFYAVSPPA
jgi:hypothetical protein